MSSNTRPGRYSLGHHSSVLRAHSWRTVDNSARYLIPYLRPGLEVLDVGSGPGTITVDIARRVAPGLVTGIDQVEAVNVQATALASSEGVQNVRFQIGDVYAIDAPDDSYDVVHAHQVLQHVSDPVAALREMRRVTKPGGIVAARDTDYTAWSWYPRPPAMDLWHEVYLRLARLNGGEPAAGSRLKAWAREAGFEEISLGGGMWAYTSEEEVVWWGTTWAERATISTFAEQAVEEGLATPEELVAMGEAWTAWSQSPDAAILIPHGELIARA